MLVRRDAPPLMETMMNEHVSHGDIPYLGAGIGLRRVHHEQILAETPSVNWFELLTENYLGRGGTVRRDLLQIAERYPMATHGVAMSIGGTDPLDWEHLRAVKQLNQDIDALWTSEHLCFSKVDHRYISGLLPLPFTAEAVEHVAARLREVQDFLEIPVLLENVTYYMVVSDREMSELEFVKAVLDEAGCGLLLDVNNVYVNARNHGFDALEFIRAIPAERIRQIHLGGHDEGGELVKDTHDQPVAEAVWDLYRETVAHAGLVTTNIEWDSSLPPLEDLLDEATRAQSILDGVHMEVA